MSKTIYVSTCYQEMLNEKCKASAGPDASISGMKKLYWGKDAFVVKCGKYIYNVDYELYMRCRFNPYM